VLVLRLGVAGVGVLGDGSVVVLLQLLRLFIFGGGEELRW
jgi:hypothetical protein